MEEKKTRNIKESPFSQDAETRRLQNAFGEAAGDLPTPEETQKEWDAFLQRHPQSRRKFRLRVTGLSAGIAAMIALSLWFWWPLQRQDRRLSDIEIFAALDAPEQITTSEANGRIIVSTPPATVTRLTLGDGTRVLLGANSRIEYPKEFVASTRRTVHLTGEARFEVTPDAHRPFIVSAGKMQTQVLGTVFDVNAYPGNAPAVTLYKGKVEVSKINSSRRKEMHPGQCATLSTDGDIHLSKVARNETEGWVNNEFYFDNTEMIHVLHSIGTWYNISVICHSPGLLHERIHFRFSRNVPPEELLAALNDLGIAHFRYTDGRIVVRSLLATVP